MKSLSAILLGLLLTLTGVSNTNAQSISAAALELAPPDSFPTIVAPRSIEAIQGDLDQADALRRAAEINRDNLSLIRSTSEDELDMKKKEIDIIKKNLDVAKKENRLDDVGALEADKLRGEQIKDILDRHKNLRKSEYEWAKAEYEYAETLKKALEAEMELSRKREDRHALLEKQSAVDWERFDRDILNLERRTLEAQKKMADKHKNLSDKEKNVIDERIKLFDAQMKIAKPKR